MKARLCVFCSLILVLSGIPGNGISAPEARQVTAPLLDGITFASQPGVWYVGVREVANAFGWPVHWEEKTHSLYVKNRQFFDARLKRLLDGTLLVALRDLEQIGGEVRWEAAEERAYITYQERRVLVREGEKRVEIDRTKQELRAWQGNRLVLKSRISTGREGNKTPLGTFRAGPYKARMHYSSLYDNAPMPWSVQVVGNIFVHGYESVPPLPASHGCIRLPLEGGNPAKWFYHWIDIGTPIHVRGRWQG
jgi:hypothetical protein